MNIPGNSNSCPGSSTKNTGAELEELVDDRSHLSSPTISAANADEYFHPPIIRERSDRGKTTAGKSQPVPDELDGDQYFEPPIVREADARTSGVFSSVFSDLHKSGSAFLSELIQALNTIG